jgi:hypothetical protein
MDEKKQTTYKIGDKTYHQRPVVIGQARQISNAIKGMSINYSDPFSVINSVGDKIVELVAIVLIPDGVELKIKNLDKVIYDIEWELSPELAIEIVTDFFIINPLSLISEKVTGAIKSLSKANPKAGEDFLPLPQAEISPNETK